MLKSKVRNSEKLVMKIQEKLMMSIVPKFWAPWVQNVVSVSGVLLRKVVVVLNVVYIFGHRDIRASPWVLIMIENVMVRFLKHNQPPRRSAVGILNSMFVIYVMIWEMSVRVCSFWGFFDKFWSLFWFIRLSFLIQNWNETLRILSRWGGWVFNFFVKELAVWICLILDWVLIKMYRFFRDFSRE